MKFIPFLVVLSYTVLAYSESNTREQAVLPMPENSFSEFFDGISNGIHTIIDSDLKVFGVCSNGFFKVFDDLAYAKAFLLKWLSHPDFAALCEFAVELSGRILGDILPCFIPYLYIVHIKDLIIGLSWNKVGTRVLTTLLVNIQAFHDGIIDFVECAKNGNSYCLGQSIGKMGYMLLFH